MKTTTVSTNGRITIPVSLRKQCGLKNGTRIVFVKTDRGCEVVKFDKNYFLKFAGILGTKGKMLEGLMKEKRKEKYL
ncbi:AbrB/MazE/SpoVT family DNA-binding domain-containing protein [Stygiobacter electus]|uniref:AbrB/MazE/SpoVT family DNA-binding domain-containing protein n=1 Tax=Stygiobacter electus TaxID=3032292 RepID=A0AAE3P2U6_9BACT|nr:AbrB/MazE/SpoVT family DNA-binding domain-containing protein [Stygiobacter electus]MDF1613235.1 AbrB/MazE/SpoVT family DNA-binding domain-containing protein [Stygiobacter electus]